MKRILVFVASVLIYQIISAQSVGIGTSTPNPKAALDINSITKGLLIPSMTSLQRTSISSPPDGLMVYDTDLHLVFHFDGGLWRKIINSSLWNNSTTRNFVYNTADSIGLGTTLPTHKLDVNGKIRVRDNILGDADAIIDGTMGAGSITTGGSLTVGGSSTLVSDLNVYGDINIINSASILQLKNGTVNKGFFQLSGDNVRLGTNSGNSTGNLIIRMNSTDRLFVSPGGNLGIGDATPIHKLDVAGDINLTGELRRTSVTGNASLVPLCYGFISGNGSINMGTGNFTVQHPSTGVYKILVDGVTVSNTAVFIQNFAIQGVSYAGPDVGVPDIIPVFLFDRNGDPKDGAFYFIAYKL